MRIRYWIELCMRVEKTSYHNLVTHLSHSSHHCLNVHKNWTKLSYKLGHSTVIRLSTTLDRAWELNKTLISKPGHSTLKQLSSSFERIHERWTISSYPSLVTQLSFNSHPVWSRMGVEQNSYPNMVTQFSYNCHPPLTTHESWRTLIQTCPLIETFSSTFDTIYPIDLLFGTYNEHYLYFRLIETLWCLIGFHGYYSHI